jgi:hypothetical protein
MWLHTTSEHLLLVWLVIWMTPDWVLKVITVAEAIRRFRNE